MPLDTAAIERRVDETPDAMMFISNIDDAHAHHAQANRDRRDLLDRVKELEAERDGLKGDVKELEDELDGLERDAIENRGGRCDE